MSDQIKLLILEDNEMDAEFLLYNLQNMDKNFLFDIARNAEEFKKSMLNFRPEIIISDYLLNDINGLEALQLAKTELPEVPFIIVTGVLDDEKAVECMEKGVWDYVLKDRLYKLEAAVIKALELREYRSEILALKKEVNEQLALQGKKAKYKIAD